MRPTLSVHIVYRKFNVENEVKSTTFALHILNKTCIHIGGAGRPKELKAERVLCLIALKFEIVRNSRPVVSLTIIPY